MTQQVAASVTRITWVRVAWREEVKTIRLTARPQDGLTEEIRFHGHVIGFIHCAGRIFVALAGARLDRAVECEQSVSWDRAAARLIIESGGFPETQTPRVRTVRPERAVGYRILAAGPSSVCGRPRIREKARQGGWR